MIPAAKRERERGPSALNSKEDDWRDAPVLNNSSLESSTPENLSSFGVASSPLALICDAGERGVSASVEVGIDETIETGAPEAAVDGVWGRSVLWMAAEISSSLGSNETPPIVEHQNSISLKGEILGGSITEQNHYPSGSRLGKSQCHNTRFLCRFPFCLIEVGLPET